VSERNVQSDRSLTGFRLVLAESNDEVGRVLGCSVQVVVDYLFDTVGISDLGVEGCSGVVRNHPVATARGVLHGPPGVIAGSRLDIPDIPRVSAELAALYGLGDCVFVADRTTSGVHQPCTLLEVVEELGVDQPTSSLVKWSVDCDNVALGDEFLEDAVSD